MVAKPPASPDAAPAALGRWEGEGGAETSGPQHAAAEREGAAAAPPTAAEWSEMKTRVIALENLVIALLAKGSEAQREAARQMGALITPRPGHTPHRLTTHASHRMADLVDRAERFDGAGR